MLTSEMAPWSQTQSDWLHDALLEVPNSSEKLSISFSPSDANEDRYRRQERNRRRKREKRLQRAGPGGLDEDEAGGDGEEEDVEDDDEEVPLFRLESVGPTGSTEVCATL